MAQTETIESSRPQNIERDHYTTLKTEQNLNKSKRTWPKEGGKGRGTHRPAFFACLIGEQC